MERLFPKARGAIIRLLFSDPEESLHLRELARRSGLAIGTIQAEVANLRAAELIQEERDGNRLYFRANRNNPIFGELQAIARKTSGIWDEVRKVLEGMPGIEFAFVYGSLGRDEGSSESDLDLFVIGTIGLRELASPLRDLSQNLNREVNVSKYSKSSFMAERKKGNAFTESVAQSAKVWLIGDEDGFAKLA
jgi:predicted nucleotidyltransferase